MKEEDRSLHVHIVAKIQTMEKTEHLRLGAIISTEVHYTKGTTNFVQFGRLVEVRLFVSPRREAETDHLTGVTTSMNAVRQGEANLLATVMTMTDVGLQVMTIRTMARRPRKHYIEYVVISRISHQSAATRHGTETTIVAIHLGS